MAILMKMFSVSRYIPIDLKDKIKLSSDTRKPVFMVFNQVPHRTGCTATEDG